MFGDGVVVSGACAFPAAPSPTTNAKLLTANVLSRFHLIDFSQDLDFRDTDFGAFILGLLDYRLIVDARGCTDSPTLS
jgi:hypothetical protein